MSAPRNMRHHVMFSRSEMHFDDRDAPDVLHAFHLMDGGRITVLDRMTGYGNGVRDVETGYRASCGRWFLASGGYDIRQHLGEFTSENDMAAWVMRHANTCTGDDMRKFYCVVQPECFA
jgi:hypothetical protein